MGLELDTIVAQATPSGCAGVGIVRVSGPAVPGIAYHLLKRELKPRYAHYGPFYDANNQIIDRGVALWFAAPHSFTGEEVLELHGHGGQVVMNMLIKAVLHHGARLARPGEFTERAYLNQKIDLLQAEAILDLITARSEEAARAAARALEGSFSQAIQGLLQILVGLRCQIEAAIDFSDEDIDLQTRDELNKRFQEWFQAYASLLPKLQQGALLRQGLKVVLAGAPNAGKSSLLNALCGEERAIVTDIAGTTRDIVQETLLIEGVWLQLLDTAGLRETQDRVEFEGIRRSHTALQQADKILWVIDATEVQQADIAAAFRVLYPEDRVQVTILYNKIDCLAHNPGSFQQDGLQVIGISAKTGAGLDILREHLRDWISSRSSEEGVFLARQRHFVALEQADAHVRCACDLLEHLELCGQELHYAQRSLAEITGDFTSDDLLGCIFSQFCIGK